MATYQNVDVWGSVRMKRNVPPHRIYDEWENGWKK